MAEFLHEKSNRHRKGKKSQVKELEKPRTLSRALIIDDKARIMGGLTRGGEEENRTKLATPFRLLFMIQFRRASIERIKFPAKTTLFCPQS